MTHRIATITVGTLLQYKIKYSTPPRHPWADPTPAPKAAACHVDGLIRCNIRLFYG